MNSGLAEMTRRTSQQILFSTRNMMTTRTISSCSTCMSSSGRYTTLVKNSVLQPLHNNTNLCRNMSSSSSSSSSSNGSNHTNNNHHHNDDIVGKEVNLYDSRDAILDLFHQYAQVRHGALTLDCDDIRNLLTGIAGATYNNDQRTIDKLFRVADMDGNGLIDMEEFLDHADTFLRSNPARIILVVGGPGSGKGVLSKRLEKECNVVHLSSGDLLRQEVARQSPLGKQVQRIIARGELVSSAIIVTLMKKRMRDHPGKRVLLDGFPRSLENAHDLVALCGKPELALHLVCDDTILMERIMRRGTGMDVAAAASPNQENNKTRREDDNFETALERLRTFHKYHPTTLDWLRQQHVPVVNLDCSGPPESVWHQLLAIGRLMRPAVKLPLSVLAGTQTNNHKTTSGSTANTKDDTSMDEPENAVV